LSRSAPCVYARSPRYHLYADTRATLHVSSYYFLERDHSLQINRYLTEKKTAKFNAPILS